MKQHVKQQTIGKMSLKDRLDHWSMPVTESGCWLWIGTISTEGYGRISVENYPHYAHRIAYEEYRGEIPAGMQLDHICRVRCCINPSHLEIVTNRENTMRGICPEVNRARILSKKYCPQGHPYFGENLYINPKTKKRHCRECARIRALEYRRKLKV